MAPLKEPAGARRQPTLLWRRGGHVARWGALLPLLLVLVFPFLVMLSMGLKPTSEVTQASGLLPRQVCPTNFLEIWSRVPLGRYLLNSLIIALGATTLSVGVALPAAYALARLQFWGRSLFLYLVLMTQMLSPVVLVLALFRLMRRVGLLDTYWSLILADGAFGVAFAVWLLTGYLATIPKDLEEAALMDGCTPLGALWRVLLPLARPGLVTTVIFAFIAGWNEFVFALTFISEKQLYPLTVGIYNFIGRYTIEWNYLMAASLVGVVPVMVLFLTIERHLVAGLTAGGIR